MTNTEGTLPALPLADAVPADFGCDAPDGCGAAPGVPCEPYCPGSATDDYLAVFCS